MPGRPLDQIRLALDGGDFDGFESVEITHSFTDIATLQIKLGDERSWKSLGPLVAPGRRVRVFCNGLLQFTGRFEVNRVPVSSSGTVLTLVARTKLSDATVASADQKLTFKNTSIRDFILKLFSPLGFEPKDFIFAAATDRDLVTGKKSGAKDLVDLEPIKAEQLRVNAPESIKEVYLRVLKRFHLMLWDAADGRLLVGRPDDTQAPFYSFRAKRGPEAYGNNILEAERIVDWTDLPSEVWVAGGAKRTDVLGAPTRGVAVDLDAYRVAQDTGHFNRRVLIPSEGAKTLDAANAQAKREMAARSRAKDVWRIKLDGWGYWDGARITPYAINTTADVEVQAVGAEAVGRYMIAELRKSIDNSDGATAELVCYAPGIYDI